MASVMSVYLGGIIAGHEQDFGPGRVLAHVRTASGKFVCIGWFEDRRSAREAIESAYRTGNTPSTPPEAA